MADLPGITGALYEVFAANWPALVVALAFTIARWVLGVPVALSGGR